MDELGATARLETPSAYGWVAAPLTQVRSGAPAACTFLGGAGQRDTARCISPSKGHSQKHRPPHHKNRSISGEWDGTWAMARRYA
jgi:hypothetical protein